jgi:hypothetical protein
MPPQQRERLLDLVDERLVFGAQEFLRLDDLVLAGRSM